MSDRLYRLFFGMVLLIGLYFESPALIWALIGLGVFEGLTALRIPVLVGRVRYGADGAAAIPCSDTIPFRTQVRFNFDAERAWRLLVAAMLFVSVFIFHAQLWWFPWFMGFAIFGAGLSGVCPVLIFLKLSGFR